MPPLSAFFRESGVADALRSGPTHLLIVGDSISALNNNVRLPAGIMREWGVKTAPIVGVRCASTSGVTDQWGRSFPGTNNSVGIDLDPGPGVLIPVSGVTGTAVLGEVVTEATTGATGIFMEQTGTPAWRILYAPGDTTEFSGSLGLSTASASATGGTPATSSVDHLGLATNIYPCAHVLQVCTGNPSTSINFYRSLLQNTSSFAQGEWTADVAMTGRLIYFRHTGGFVGKKRTYRNNLSQNSTNFSQATAADNTIAYTEQDCGSGSGIPCEIRWEALSGDETGQFGKMCGAMFYRPSTTGITLDSVSIGGDGISFATNTGRCSDAHYGEYLTATNVHTNGTLVVMVYYGQNDGLTSRSTFESTLDSIITRFTSLGATAGYSAVKFMLVGHYNTGGDGTHLKGKNEACYTVAGDYRTKASYLNLFDRWSYNDVNTTLTSDTIHPTLAFAQTIASVMADQITSPSSTSVRSRQNGRSRDR